MCLIVNADDWGRDRETTDRTLDCVLRGSVSSVSAMVFMEDSERATAIAQQRRVSAGLHLNLTTPFSAPSTPRRLVEHQRRLSVFLQLHRFARVIYNPFLTDSFKYVVAAQYDEFARLYGSEPERVDGHHHMHLCSNVLFGQLLSRGAIVRRNFSFQTGEKSLWNRLYRREVDRILARRHRMTDLFYALPPVEQPDRVQKIFALARHFSVEVETHPVIEQEHRFLSGDEVFRCAGDIPIEAGYTIRAHGQT